MKTNGMWASLTCQTSWREVNNQCNHINSQLELYKFLNIYVNWTSPFGHCHNRGEIIIQNYHISTFFSHLNLVKISWIVPMFSNGNIRQHCYMLTSVPAMPIASPISASWSAGASFVPSPVTATTSPNEVRKCFTGVCLSRGEDRAITYRYKVKPYCY